jgi:hypothetical protein
MPRLLNKKRRRRKISLEVHRTYRSPTKFYDECFVRVLEPATKAGRRAARRRARHRTSGQPEASLATIDAEDDEDDGDEDSTVVPAEYLDGARDEENTGIEGWRAKYRFPISGLKVKNTYKDAVIVAILLGKLKQTRELIFDSVSLAEDFCKVLEKELEGEEQRAEAKVKAEFGDIVMPQGEITLLMEIVSGWNLPIGDFDKSDPFVICMLNGKEVHRTKYISKTLDPIWTLKTGSLFLLTINPKELFLSEGLLCLVMDFDKVGKNEKLGAITIPPRVLFDSKGDRMEFKLGPPPGKTGEVDGHLAIRCRRASEHDIHFLKDYADSQKRNALQNRFHKEPAQSTDTKGGSGNIASYFRRQSRTVKDGNEEVKEYKVRPGPHPKRKDQTTWMTHDQVEKESLKESEEWIDTGSGKLGRLFVEIIGCDDLPNLDTGGRNKTDTFVSIVYQDSVVSTDIIDDCLSPRWMPWTKRAFIFHIMHSSSQLFLGVFDFDEGINPTDDHDLVGRVSVDLTNLRKDTLYTLKYNIFTTARMADRKRRGSITVRLRLEIEDDRKLLLSNLEPPPDMYVNVKKRKDFRVVRYTCTGKYDMTKYDMKYINSYIEELLSIQHVLYYLQDALMALILWRGTLPIEIRGETYKFPVHSLSAFIAAVLLVEQPQLIPSLFFGCIAWLIIAIMDYRQNLPDLWSRCKTFREFIYILFVGKSPISPHNIKQYEQYEEAKKFLEDQQKRIEESEKAAERAYEESVKAQEEYEREMEEIGEADVDISTKTGGVSLDPFKPILFPVQQNLALICRYLRHVRYVLFWEECYIAFWVSAGCLLLSIICVFIPWFFLIKWTSRFLVWFTFGPWMKLVDVYYVSKIKPPTEAEIQEKKKLDREKRRLQTSAAAAKARVKRENATKLKAMKKYMFGRYIAKVPILKEDRYRDLPLPSSTAVPYRPKPLPLSELAMQEAGYHRTRLPGQHLVGDMIPRAETLGFTEAPIGQATAHPRLVDKKRPGGNISSGLESTTSAYAKIGSLIVAAGLISWFCVPVFAAMAEKVINFF